MVIIPFKACFYNHENEIEIAGEPSRCMMMLAFLDKTRKEMTKPHSGGIMKERKGGGRMIYRELGKTGMKISIISMGCEYV